jgi:methionyl-tRNA formyltransferase
MREQDGTQSRYLPRPTDSDRIIDWSWTAVEIDAMVRACNPVYGGALTLLKGIPLRILETSPTQPATDSKALPGTLLAASGAEGLRVACGQGEALFVEIAYAMDGFFSGKRLAKIFGLRPGDRLG